ncbi:MFS transporter [Corynebacterium pseudotuberculosis]|uniref:MFS transporter n=1 Tax=Corynebacterium pseudotuberculosis TaxID=1719 RepID=UPI00227EB55F|nr:MFS transporter [Corynebacterium pseudotuberculosis]WAF22270.1 MFS transporter [Corynebacterium pseudotuberculosis]
MSHDSTQSGHIAPSEQEPTPQGANAVLIFSTVSFTMMFAVWLMFGILGTPIQKEFGLSDTQLSWILAVAILNGSMWRLPAGILADKIGGRKVMLGISLFSAAASLGVAFSQNYAMTLVLAFLVGFCGNSFTAGAAWTSAWFPKHKQGFALGVFGAGNVGASVTKFIGPIIIASTAGSTYLGFIPAGWRLIPIIYSALLIIITILMMIYTPKVDRFSSSGRSLSEMLTPLKQVRVWRFSLYYVVVFGAYVALSATLPKYYIANYDVSLAVAGLLTAIFIFPASLLRPVGGWFSDRYGARRAMYGTFFAMAASAALLSLPSKFISIFVFTALVFILGCAMGIGKAAVYKHIPEYFPHDVGAVGGLVGMLGGLGGFFLPPLFAYTKTWTGWSTSPFIVLFALVAVSALWMHLTVHRMLHKQVPELKHHLEMPVSH